MNGWRNMDTRYRDEEVYSVGECPACPGAGNVLALLATHASAIFYCSSCGTAWREVPNPMRLDSVERLADLAPSGVRALTREEVTASGLEIVEVLKTSEVDDELRRLLERE